MEQARELHNSWVLQASHSRTFQAAKDEYRRRYQRHPPPGFDKWYEYATARSSIIIDDFDSIFKDLLPFWALNPPTLRSLTAEIISNPWNELAKVSIRNGRAEFGDTIPTHGWMLEGIMEMLGNFAQWLPDMDLAFNINDESRVAIPYETYQQSQEIGLEIGRLDRKQDPKWSEDREHSWPILGESNQAPSRFYDHSFTRTFHSYGSISCPPNSTARTTRIWDVSRLCTRCISPHSLGPFLSNWTLSASPCHQPDVANLHGFYLSPSAFKTAREPIPVFSQSKAHGYADILYPSPWNYMDKIKYDPSDEVPDKPFSEKENTLFWRGATSEGFSTTGQWKGMTRQRLVYLTHNTTIHSVPNTAIPVPHPSKPGISTYVYVPPASLNLSINVGIVDKIVRSDDADYHYQAAQFAPLLPHSEFQDHWKYRYLVDVDGAGFSGRFLPFLLSKSLPFKAALFREWYDGRITAWKHFVPLDLRLHGLFPTLAYFAGANYRGTKLRSHERAGEEIAESGREWASKVLRKEDMEIYFFRLLLEWGRMTDDRRDEIGIDN
ncbi:hypothetical protein MMC09_000068 [Bachmanniomyces sp. S44760]|nr:hypothetical protein [Bachmanniomyces sp. S44760]